MYFVGSQRKRFYMANTHRLETYVSEDDAKTIDKAAQVARLSRSTWMRLALIKAAQASDKQNG